MGQTDKLLKWMRRAAAFCGHFFETDIRATTAGDSAESGDRFSAIRKNIEISEQVLYHAEKGCKLAEQRYVVGEADESELDDARNTFVKAKLFFVQSLRELQSALVELDQGTSA